MVKTFYYRVRVAFDAWRIDSTDESYGAQRFVQLFNGFYWLVICRYVFENLFKKII